MTRTITRVVTLAVALAFGATAAAAQSAPKPDAKKPAAESLAGKWTLSAETPHGSMEFGLAIKQEGAKITGTFTTPQNGDIPIAGEYTEGTLTFHLTNAPDGFPALAFKARLKDDGTLAGTMSSDANDMVFVGKRAK
jgi:hypothetical protein